MEYLWFIVGIGLIITEISIGSAGFYLVGIGLISILTGCFAFIKPDLTFENAILLFSATSILVCFFMFVVRKRFVKLNNENMNLDVGQPVKFINKISNIYEVEYRGAVWEANLIGEPNQNNEYEVNEVIGNKLVIKSRHK